MLRDRLLLLTLPDKDKRFRSQIHWVPKAAEVKALVNELRLKLEKTLRLWKHLQRESAAGMTGSSDLLP